MGPVSSVNGAMDVAPGASDGTSYSCWWSYAGCVRWETRELLKAGFSLAATVVCMGASPGVMASVGGQTKNAGLKSRVDAPLHFSFGLDRQWQFQQIQFRTSQKMRGIELCF